ncbi:hypothetical protein KL86PLE_40912 [uncultured Pleomorphomonas sp.]|uniref:Uncharacterized protein n=1 Tax=uncultured Pleomorphomonas sp. TaxID=442121 RepID=A0A212LI05_9HYPH|nr:hypothetical protein KL86PLE_40912 [uncultured Pleomorphomonas sp.]
MTSFNRFCLVNHDRSHWVQAIPSGIASWPFHLDFRRLRGHAFITLVFAL